MDVRHKKMIMFCAFLVNIFIRIESHILEGPPLVPTHMYGMPYTGPNNLYLSNYFSPRGNMRQFAQGGANQHINFAKYGGALTNPLGRPGFLNSAFPATSSINRVYFDRRPPLNPGSMFQAGNYPLINMNEYFQGNVEVSPFAITSSDDEDDERGGINPAALLLLEQESLVGGAHAFHHMEKYHRRLRTPPPFYLFPTMDGNRAPPSDIVLVIHTSQILGRPHPTGRAIWHRGLLNFVNRFVRTANLSPGATRIGIVAIGHQGIEGLVPIMSDQRYLLASLTNMHSSFRGQCSDRGLLVAKNMMYQYGRPFAAKRIVLISDGIGCAFPTLPGMMMVRESGIDIIHIRFGGHLEGFVEGVPPALRPFWPLPIEGDVGRFIPLIAERIFMRPLNGGWSPWSAWNRCSARGECRVGHQMRFRICDNPRPSFGGRPCSGFPTETRFCRSRHCAAQAAGYWTPWSLFSPCSSHCGRGTRTRTRMCLTFDGQPSVTCTGRYVDTRTCAVNECPAVGGWSSWSGWGMCSRPCGPGIQIRSRTCDQPFPAYGGPRCPGSSIEERVCIVRRECPINGGFGPWRMRGGCIARCGRGYQRLVRECNNPVPQYGGMPCIGRYEMRRPCDTGVSCPIPGGWSPWSAFSHCSVSCGRGMIFRRRTCTAPVPQYHGPPCVGPSVQERECDAGVPCPIDGQWSGWTDISQCSVTCGRGHLYRSRLCNNPAPLYGGRPCLGSPTETIPCNTDIPCPVDGGWSSWSETSPCSVRCGVGVITRHRQCNNPVPDGGANCFGQDSDQISCDTGVTCPESGVWSQWGPWSTCSEECGIGVRQRVRVCDNPFQIPGGEISCVGSPIQLEPCDTLINCPVSGGWSQWSDSGPCSSTCGIGTTRLVRYCNSPTPAYGGDGCMGPNEDFVQCNTGIDCPIDGGWSVWLEWEHCKGVCGIGTQRRTRVCNNPAPMYLGADCLGDLFEERTCDTGNPCPVDGAWSPWGEWGVCSADCGSGVKVRRRQCNSPSPMHGGLACSGLDVDEVPCSTGRPCPIDGGWSTWTPFAPCSASCGEGIMIRSRACDNPVPMHNGKMCFGSNQEEIPCNTQVECPVHGGWSPWSQFSQCSASCGSGFQERRRECNSPSPMFGGETCFGDATERIECLGLNPCPVHGQWSEWSAFGPCDVPCGNGLKRRTRLCNNPAPQFGGDQCYGYPIDEVLCDAAIQCPVDGNWSPWSQFSMCSVTCGVGVQVRKRLCNNPPPMFNGANCFGHPLEERECHAVQCPVNGGWSIWSEFGQCSASCGEGVKRRVRECTNPPPSFNGLDCEGPMFEEGPCINDKPCPIDGGWSLWSGWETCSSLCGTGITERVRECSNPPPLFGGKICQGVNREEMVCETGIACQIDGGWGLWAEFSPCSTPCGPGVSQRHRVCDSPVPQYKGKPCPGSNVESIPCNNDIPCPVDGGFSFWSPWGPCMAECGQGVQSRTRKCDSPPPLHGGKPCIGEFVEDRVCESNVPCPVNGEWGPWSAYTPCAGPCGIGSQTRYRSCDNPIPLYGGLECLGQNIDVQPCDTGMHCPVHGGWSIWMPWSKCSVSCDTGIQTRSRVCSNPEPMYGGNPCNGADHQEQRCSTGIPCPVDGGFSFWSEWSQCSVNCGTGVQSRSRVCDSPPPLNGGKPCIGDPLEERICVSDIGCPVDGHWGPWSTYTPCVGICGFGTQERTRICDQPRPLNGGMDCQGPNSELLPCDTGIHCPLDGNWNGWMPWSDCSTTCDIGIRGRTRVCNNPEPMYGGKPCFGVDHHEEPCDTGISCSINGNWGPWTNWQPCDAACGKGLQIRTRQCDNPPTHLNGLPCFGDNKETIVCDSGIPCPVDGSWSFWSEWGLCSVTCGVGVQERFRTCSAPEPAFGGLKCIGHPVESLPCATGVSCPVDGHWTIWSPWTPCSKSCGLGTQMRVRECADPIPANGGMPCLGVDKEINDCFNHCPMDGNWSPWAESGPCSSPCGIGVVHRTRTCTEPAPSYGGVDCKGPAADTVECQVVPCPVDGGWSHWNGWSRCQGTCGLGVKVRLRECSNPPPSLGGKPCIGIDHETSECDTTIPCPVDGHWSPWSPWGACDANCGVGLQYRERTCSNPVPSNGGRICLGDAVESIRCDTGIPCSINGGWSAWSGWSVCDAECGVGAQVKIRYCTNPKPSFGGLPCVGDSKKTRLCDTGIPCPVDGNWATWSSWTSCDAPCGTGHQTRYRTCTNPRPQYNGLLCPGVPEEGRQCDTGIPCRADGEWGYWSQWSACSTDCGIGKQIRTRQCNYLKPSNYPVYCPGNGDESRICTATDGCPQDGGWSSWEAWSACSVTCGTGFARRYRRCDNPPPLNGGLPCLGPEVEIIDCVVDPPCLRPGGWSSWESWTGCSTTCGAGVQYRNRRCDSPPPIGPNMDCKGWPEDNQICNTAIACPIHGGWSTWTDFGPCTADCTLGVANSKGIQTRQRYCDSPPPQNGGNPCVGSPVDDQPCTNFPPCPVPVWGPWSQWSTCSQECGEGFTERKRVCLDENTGLPSSGCLGVNVQTLPCQERVCPTIEVNCSTECKWDNGIGYATYPGDCSKFIQCDSLFGEPKVHDCPWGLLWSLNILQCVYPEQSECELCVNVPSGTILPYYLTCKSYWVCNNWVPIPKCCPEGQRFDHALRQCALDPLAVCQESCPPVTSQITTPGSIECAFRPSSQGGGWYQQNIAGVWITRPCSTGTIFSETMCACIVDTNTTTGPHIKECLPELHLTFDTLQRDLERNIGIHIENVTYLGDGTAHFNGSGAINSNIFSNAEWGNDVFVHIRFKPEGNGRNQGLVHNSGCGPSDVGPSVFIGLDRTTDLGPNKMNMKFAAVPLLPNLQYEFINVTVPDNKLIDAWFKFSDGLFRAEVDGKVAEIPVPGGRPIARRHGAINIAGNLCRIGDEAFGGFEGIVDEVRIYKCKPPR